MVITSSPILTTYLTPEQATVLRYDGTLPSATLASLCATLRSDLAGLRSLLPNRLFASIADLAKTDGAYRDGTVLCADLSGFTALTSQLVAADRQGVEELCSIINQVFAALLEEIVTYGGSVLKFGGDGLTVFFDAADLGDQHALSACTAALVLQQRMQAFEHFATSCGAWTLRLRVAVHSGPIFIASIGDQARRELLTTGRTINQVALAQERAAPGEVLVSAATLELLAGAETEPRSGGLARLCRLAVSARAARLPPPPLLPQGNDLHTMEYLAAEIEALQPYLPSALPQRFLRASSMAIGEFRPVSMVFVNFFSFSGLLSLLDGEEHVAVRGLDAYYRGVHRLVQQYGGSINKIDISGFGDKMLLLFGAPHAHEDDPLRAVQAALELNEVLDNANRTLRATLDAAEDRRSRDRDHMLLPPWRAINPLFRQRIGVTTGTVFAGMVGTARRREYTVIGHAVNIAARLMDAAEPNSVLLGPGTARIVADQVALQVLPPRQLKGIAAPLPIVQAFAGAPQPLSPPAAMPSAPLFGRATELATLRGFAHETLAGVGRVVTVVGEAGIGKTRLAHELLDELHGSTMGVIALSCHDPIQPAPPNLAHELLCQILGLPSASDLSILREPLTQMVADYAPAHVSSLPLLDGLLGPDSQPLSERLLDLLVSVVSGLIERQPLALLVDDLHEANESSRALVRRLAGLTAIRPLLLLLAYRSEASFVEPWLALPATSCLELGALDTDSSSALLAHLLGDAVPDELTPLLDRAEGSPFFLEAFFRHLTATGTLRRSNGGRWQLRKPLSALSLPISIERALAARLDQFDEATRELLQVAAVIGVVIPYALLAGVYSQARQLAYRVTQLVYLGVFVIDEHDPQAPVRFRQTLLREVAYNSILYAQRRELHRQVATRIGQLHENELDQYAPELARHYRMAEEWSLAFHYSLRAARHAADRGAVAEARTAYQQAAEIAAAAPDALDEIDQHHLAEAELLLKQS